MSKKRGVTVPTPDNGQPQPGGNHSRKAVLGIFFVLAMMVLAVFGQTLRHEFVNYDDAEYVYENSAVARGLNLEGIVWAFTQFHASNWHPVTWLSHMLDCELYGLNPGGHHLTNVLIHASTAILLFLVLRSMTGAQWCSAFVAALFALHPLRVESVAWVAERKDLLSGLFFMLTLWAYTRYAKVAAGGWRVAGFSYLCVVLFFALGLMSKPMLVTLPFVLLLLDYWPLRRLPDGVFQISNFKFVIGEKLPLFAMSAASCVVTVLAQRDATVEVEKLPVIGRLGNALVAYITYLWQTVWPTGLAAYYPHPQSRLSVLPVILSALFLAGACAVVFVARRKLPYAVTGWLWFLGMLVPVIGLVQVGAQAHADRYTYLPQIGLFILLAWGVADLSAGWRHRRLVCAGAAALVLAVLAASAWVQAFYWRDSATLWTRTLAVTSRNSFGHFSMGHALALQEKSADAIEHYQLALKITPDYGEVHNNLGNLLASQGRIVEATRHFRHALRFLPDGGRIYANMGNASLLQGRLDEAVENYRQALRIHPGDANVYFALGKALGDQGKFPESIDHYRQAVKINPGHAKAHGDLGAALQAHARFAEAVEHYMKALETEPEDVSTLNNLGWIFATCPDAMLRNGSRAIELARRAEALSSGRNPSVLDTVAAAFAEAGRFPEAVETARRALEIAVNGGDSNMARSIRERLKLYESGSPYHDEAGRP